MVWLTKGASDVDQILNSNTTTKSFAAWWLSKIGIAENHFSNEATMCGTWLEHRILNFVDPQMELDKQIRVPSILLRANLDGNTSDTIHECKTAKIDKWPWKKPPPKYVRQVRVQMYAWLREYGFIPKAEINAYAVDPGRDYKNYFLPIEPERLQSFSIEYDEKWVTDTFLPALEYKADCLKNGVWPER